MSRDVVLHGPPPRWRMIGLPILSVMIASMLPSTLPYVAQMPLVPPLGLMMLIAWRLLRPELWPVWVGAPLGLFDDMVSGQPFGSAICLWSMIMLGIAVIEQRIRWIDHWLEWAIASCAIGLALAAGLLFANLTGGNSSFAVIVPQLLAAALFYPAFTRLAAIFDRIRLAR